MKISTKGRYALRIMLDLAQRNNGSFITLNEIAERQCISEKYLESIIVVLSKAQYLRALRGKGGGYQLAREPHEYSVGSILRLTEGSLAPVACLEDDFAGCGRSADCLTRPMWQQLDQLINSYFDSITLDDLLHGRLPS